MCQTQVMVISRDQVMQVCYSSIPFDLYAEVLAERKVVHVVDREPATL